MFQTEQDLSRVGSGRPLELPDRKCGVLWLLRAGARRSTKHSRRMWLGQHSLYQLRQAVLMLRSSAPLMLCNELLSHRLYSLEFSSFLRSSPHGRLIHEYGATATQKHGAQSDSNTSLGSKNTQWYDLHDCKYLLQYLRSLALYLYIS